MTQGSGFGVKAAPVKISKNNEPIRPIFDESQIQRKPQEEPSSSHLVQESYTSENIRLQNDDDDDEKATYYGNKYLGGLNHNDAQTNRTSIMHQINEES
jgi:hypothetical protein